MGPLSRVRRAPVPRPNEEHPKRRIAFKTGDWMRASCPCTAMPSLVLRIQGNPALPVPIPGLVRAAKARLSLACFTALTAVQHVRRTARGTSRHRRARTPASTYTTSKHVPPVRHQQVRTPARARTPASTDATFRSQTSRPEGPLASELSEEPLYASYRPSFFSTSDFLAPTPFPRSSLEHSEPTEL